MPLVQTQQFGPLNYDPSAEIEFPQGLPGFEHEHRFVVLEPSTLAPVVFLQSASTPSLCFTALPVAAIDPAYDLSLNAEDHALLGAGSSVPLALLSANEGGKLTANLLAPVVVNLTRRIAAQIVRWDTKYSHSHPLGEEASCS
jgi:flagellar assembly factor FliW